MRARAPDRPRSGYGALRGPGAVSSVLAFARVSNFSARGVVLLHSVGRLAVDVVPSEAAPQAA